MAAGVCFSYRLLHARALNEVLTITASDDAQKPAHSSMFSGEFQPGTRS